MEAPFPLCPPMGLRSLVSLSRVESRWAAAAAPPHAAPLLAGLHGSSGSSPLAASAAMLVLLLLSRLLYPLLSLESVPLMLMLLHAQWNAS